MDIAGVSTARQANEGESLEVQRRQIKGYADMHGLALEEIVVEEGVSGSVRVQDRPRRRRPICQAAAL
jgi:DNA invertase Pin-like site-specific DNA recombinase